MGEIFGSEGRFLMTGESGGGGRGETKSLSARRRLELHATRALIKTRDETTRREVCPDLKICFYHRARRRRNRSTVSSPADRFRENRGGRTDGRRKDDGSAFRTGARFSGAESTRPRKRASYARRDRSKINNDLLRAHRVYRTRGRRGPRERPRRDGSSDGPVVDKPDGRPLCVWRPRRAV